MHSHYWLSGQVGWLAKERWGVPLVHTAHTLAKVKNALLAAGDAPEPTARVIGEEQVVDAADRLVANTPTEARELVRLVRRATRPGQRGRARRRPGPLPAGTGRVRGQVRLAARRRFGLPTDGYVVAFVGPHPAAEGAGRAAAGESPNCVRSTRRSPGRLTIAVVGGNSGSGLDLAALAESLGIQDAVRFLPPQAGDALAEMYRAADVVAVPSYNESFGLVAMEAQACGTPVVAAAVGGLVTAVRDGTSGVLVDGHDPQDWARVLGDLLAEPARRAALWPGARWSTRSTTPGAVPPTGLLDVYREAMFDHHARVAARTRCRAAAWRRGRAPPRDGPGDHRVHPRRSWTGLGAYRRGAYVVTLPGTHKLTTVVNLIVGRHALRIEAFVMRQPDERREELWAYLLRRNARMYGVAFDHRRGR